MALVRPFGARDIVRLIDRQYPNWKSQAVRYVGRQAMALAKRKWQGRKTTARPVKKARLHQTAQAAPGKSSRSFGARGRRKRSMRRGRRLRRGRGGRRFGKRAFYNRLGVVSTPILTLMSTTAGRHTSSQGLQSSNVIVNYYDQTDINNQFNQTPGPFTVPVNVGNTRKIFGVQVKSEIMFSNRHTGTICMKVYDIVARRDLEQAGEDPKSAWQAGMVDEDISALGSPIDQYGCTPFRSVKFCQLYRVVKVNHVILAPGQVHIHRNHYRVNRFIQREYESNYNYYRNMTHFTMITVYGTPQNDTSDVTKVSIPSVAVDYVINKRYEYKWMYNNETTWGLTGTQLANNLTLVAPITDLEGEGVYNKEPSTNV